MEEGRKEDRRVRRTKKLLTQALTELLQRKQVKDITVTELTELADMNRGTFYLYYRDIFDMLEKIEDEMFLSLDRILMPMKDGGILPIHQVLLALFRFTGEQREMCRVLLSPNGDMNFLHRLNEVVREKCRSAWQSFHGEGAGEEEAEGAGNGLDHPSLLARVDEGAGGDVGVGYGGAHARDVDYPDDGRASGQGDDHG